MVHESPIKKLDPLPGGHKTWRLFLLLGFTPLKVVVVVMVPRSEVGWHRENAEGIRTKRWRQLSNHNLPCSMNLRGEVLLCLLCTVICASVGMDVSSDLLKSFLVNSAYRETQPHWHSEKGK